MATARAAQAHGLRTVNGVLVETPLAPADRAGPRWAALIWRDPTVAGGWQRLLWTAHLQGFTVPVGAASGSLVEFGADRRRRLRANVPHRWFGYIVSYDLEFLVVYGPLPTIGATEIAASEFLAPARRNALRKCGIPHRRPPKALGPAEELHSKRNA